METILKREVISNKALIRVISVSAFVVLMTIGAFVRIPLAFTPVPITLQTFFVLLSGAILGTNLGVITQLSYIILGVSGLTIFSGGSNGLLYLFGPTGGYLIGFIFAALFLGKFIKHCQNNLFSIFILFCLADFMLLFCGVIWLKFILGYSLMRTMIIGFIPFIPGDLLKAMAAALIYLRLKPRLKEIF